MKIRRVKQIHFVAAILCCFTAAMVFAQAQKLVPIPIELPRPSYEGTPQNLKVANLERPVKRGPFLAPAGVVNVAKGKKVTSSDKDAAAAELQAITDGDKTQVDGNEVELAPGVQYITIDLGGTNEIYAVCIWHYFAPRVYFSTVVQTADDAAFTKNVQTIFSNDMENKTKTGTGKDQNYIESYQGKLVDAKGVRGRFVRLYSGGNNANSLNNYIEVEVYARAAS